MEGQCHYLDGNTRAAKKTNHLKKQLAKLGIDPQRLEMYNLSAAMGPRWAEMCDEFTDRIRDLGPSPVWLSLRGRKEHVET